MQLLRESESQKNHFKEEKMKKCSEGELFNQIQPDLGMPKFLVQNFLNQLIHGLEFSQKKN